MTALHDALRDSMRFHGDHDQSSHGNRGASTGGEPRHDKDGATNIQKMLKMVAQTSGREPGRPKSSAAIILDHGREYKPGPDTYKGPRGQQGACYMNAGRMVLNSSADEGLTYVEGYMTVYGIPIEHAWVVDKSGAVIDPTIKPDDNGHAYFGVPFTTDYVRETALRTGMWGIISGMSNRELFTESDAQTRSHVKKFNEGGPVAAGLAVLALDTGRVLMLRRAFNPHDGSGEVDEAAGTWEFPGGHVDDGEDAFDAARREWEEEVGLTLPPGAIHGEWTSPNGVYQGYVYAIRAEADVPFSNDRDEVTNPDDPDGDGRESLAWWEPNAMRTGEGLRRELAGDIALVCDAIGERPTLHEALRAALRFHLPGEHDQADHGQRNGWTASNRERKEREAAKKAGATPKLTSKGIIDTFMTARSYSSPTPEAREASLKLAKQLYEAEGVKVEIRSITNQGSAPFVEMEIWPDGPRGPRDEPLASLVREFREGGDVHNSYFRINRGDMQGGGLAARIAAHSERQLFEAGFKTLSLNANIDVGKYAWAKQGFDFADPHVATEKRERLVEFVAKETGLNIGQAEAKVAQLARANGGLKHAWEFAALDDGKKYEWSSNSKRGDGHLGKAFMLADWSWDGVKQLDPDSTSQKVSRAYIEATAKKGGKK